MWHLYAQYFHPTSLLERIRDVRFYRNPRTIFKGFKVPEWATAEKRHGWEVDYYSRRAWDQAHHEFLSESTPYPFCGERQEPNPLQWFRLEHYGRGKSARLFYNEVPEPTWHRHKGHMDFNKRDELLYSFTWGDQRQPINLGFDTTIKEERDRFTAHLNEFKAMAPEMFSSDADVVVFPHEVPKALP